MSTRRIFLKHVASVGVAALASSACAPAKVTPREEATTENGARVRKPGIRSVVRRDETTLRLGGQGDNFHMSWAADDRQFVALCDGTGWIDPPRAWYNSRLFAIRGGPHDAEFEDVPGYPDLKTIWTTENSQRYYGFGTLALDGCIYQFLSVLNHPSYPRRPGTRFVGAKLIYSADNGRTWCNQNGSSPVVWERWEDRSRHNMVFFEESQDAFALTSILQMGRGYSANQDGYVYVYSPNGSTEGTMNELVMFRVPKQKLLERASYEYFAGRRRDGSATWTKDIDARGVVHTFSPGWVNTGGAHPFAWHPSVVYNAPLGVYLMANWAPGMASDGSWFGKPSYFGFWVASQPWGPWTQIHEETAWKAGGESSARAYEPQIAPKWIAADGKSFWLVWTDFQVKDEAARQQLLNDQEQVRNPTTEDQLRWGARWREIQPYYSFNTQRVDLIVA